MNDEAKSRLYTTILESTERTDEVYETIGQHVLSMWNSELDTDNLSTTAISPDPLNRIIELLSKSNNTISPDSKKELKSLFEQLTPADYAISGKELCLALLELSSLENSSKSSPKKEISSLNTINIIPSNVNPTPKSEKVKKVAQKQLPNSKINSQKQLKSKPPAQLYDKFPAWLPTMTEF